MVLAFGRVRKGNLSLSEAGEPVESQKSVAEVGSKEEAVGSVFIPAFEILVGAIKCEEILIVFRHSGSESKNNTYMHLLVQIIAEFGGNSEVGMHIAGQMIVGGCVASGVGIPVIATIGVEANLSTNDKLCISSKSESCKHDSQYDSFHCVII